MTGDRSRALNPRFRSTIPLVGLINLQSIELYRIKLLNYKSERRIRYKVKGDEYLEEFIRAQI